MKRIEQLIHKFKLFHWNIGFVRNDIKSILLEQKSVLEIHWVKHSYRDRFFADPFILSVSENEIQVLVEEFFYKEWKGVITLLCIDKMSYELINRKVLLDLPTHLSFPFIYRENEKIYVLPENANSQSLFLYEYNHKKQELSQIALLLPEPIIDPTLYKFGDYYYLFCTKKGRMENSNLYMYRSLKLMNGYEQISSSPIKINKSSARPGGWMGKIEDSFYRISQNSTTSYGEGLTINKKISNSFDNYEEVPVLSILPNSKYKYGIHTLHYYNSDICVVDGLKYIFAPLYKINRFIKCQNNIKCEYFLESLNRCIVR
jgi:hypothetical protein